jgi:hypothetical protein
VKTSRLFLVDRTEMHDPPVSATLAPLIPPSSKPKMTTNFAGIVVTGKPCFFCVDDNGKSMETILSLSLAKQQ